jgi:hypothetical protein
MAMNDGETGGVALSVYSNLRDELDKLNGHLKAISYPLVTNINIKHHHV